ncbi:hypothetical protein CONPUDRAFT_154020 [Coniophora puteana RWD-64-598 SS2]|uniref:Uncharacterized protein n=1 Tax=Coniophora puteana (strain RWD-64-598) TaxID=741705 RepID=A0A5M3MQM2_CONPW|nr:uncharacterized protein CONPUDRAFT_154020 [Coniophora puteana RWD-64-598 SS2]EIW81479.1 hypothetical protein CONPUDRAFT_154020 [Coniophora puteana RWD-64-598 SS2]
MAPTQAFELSGESTSTASSIQGILLIVVSVVSLGFVCMLITYLITVGKRWRKQKRERERIAIITNNKRIQPLPSPPTSRSSSSSGFVTAPGTLSPSGSPPLLPPKAPAMASIKLPSPRPVCNPCHLGTFEPAKSSVHGGVMIMRDGSCGCGCGEMMDKGVGVATPRRKTDAPFENVPLDGPPSYRCEYLSTNGGF